MLDDRAAGKATRWLRVLVEAVLVCYLTFLPVHLAVDGHAHDGGGQAPHAIQHDPGHEGHEKHHVPHPASEHDVQILPKWQAAMLCLALTLAPSSICLDQPCPASAPEPQHDCWQFGESIPDPLLPRSPPAA